ncbi:MAG: molybdopterin molybdotransferase MoeA, partial [Saprospiraceae bacterium]|nr:molybdopterin molybdotransferase MoeA [Saprospiraceae bacterium]
MLSVSEALKIILEHRGGFGSEPIEFLRARGRVLGAPIVADRDIPPYNRVAMDGIAIRFEEYKGGCRQFDILGVVGAGEQGPETVPTSGCVEIMTGAALPPLFDTVIPYEHIDIQNGRAEILALQVKSGQNVHWKASDKPKGAVLALPGKVIGTVEMSVAASVGASMVHVKRLPKVAVFSSGNELVEVHELPNAFQIRRSNVFAIHAGLQSYSIEATYFHLSDDELNIRTQLAEALNNFDVLILSGGISAGKFDYIPEVLVALGVQKKVHKVKQRPGKPFWFGVTQSQKPVFALPGNPISTLVCFLKYVRPWLDISLGFNRRETWAQLSRDLNFEPE